MDYSVLSPWGEVDKSEVRGLAPRVSDLSDKTIGLFAGFKGHWVLVLQEIERQLKYLWVVYVKYNRLSIARN